MTDPARSYRTGFEKVFDSPAGRHILTQLRAATPPADASPARTRRPADTTHEHNDELKIDVTK